MAAKSHNDTHIQQSSDVDVDVAQSALDLVDFAMDTAIGTGRPVSAVSAVNPDTGAKQTITSDDVCVKNNVGFLADSCGEQPPQRPHATK